MPTLACASETRSRRAQDVGITLGGSMAEDPRDVVAQGNWWLPGKEDTQVPGIIKYSVDNGSELQLIGSLPRPRTGNDGIYPRIHGFAGGMDFTLEDCFQRHWNGHDESISAQKCYTGILYTEDEPNTDGMTVNMRYLTPWTNRRGITEEDGPASSHPSDDRPFSILTARLQPDLSVVLADGVELTLAHWMQRSAHTGVEQSLRERYQWKIKFQELVTTITAIEYASDLQDLVTIATGRVAEYDEILFFHPDLRRMVGESEHRLPIKLLTDWIPRDTSNSSGQRHAVHMFFTFDELGGIDGVKKWMDAMSRHRSALGRVMASKYRKGLFVEDRLFHRAAAIEAFARTRIGNNKVKLPGALRHCCDLAGPIFERLVGDTEAWHVVAKSNRDDIGHHLGKRPNQSGSAMYFLAESLYWLFVLCALKEADAPDAVFKHISTHSDLAWLAPKIQAVVQAG